jgi:hypothetical protein
VASGRGHDAAISIRQRDAVLLAGHLQPGERVTLPVAPYVHLFVPVGAVELDGAGPLADGDAVRITGSEGAGITAGPDGAEVLVWEMRAGLRAG